MTNIPVAIQNATSRALIERYSGSSDFWSTVSDICAAIVVVSIFAEVLELLPKALKAISLQKWKWVERIRAPIIKPSVDWSKKYRHWIDLFGFAFWMLLVVALAGEVLGSRIARHFDSLTIAILTPKDRKITKEQTEVFIAVLKDVKKGPIMLGARHPDRETALYSDAIYRLIASAGFEIESVRNYPEDFLPVNEGAWIDIRYDATNAPSYMMPLCNAFMAAGMQITLSSNFAGRPYSIGEGVALPGKVLVMIVEKP